MTSRRPPEDAREFWRKVIKGLDNDANLEDAREFWRKAIKGLSNDANHPLDVVRQLWTSTRYFHETKRLTVTMTLEQWAVMIGALFTMPGPQRGRPSKASTKLALEIVEQLGGRAAARRASELTGDRSEDIRANVRSMKRRKSSKTRRKSP